jgi:flagellar hook-associated protein 3 FlgL
MSVNLSTSLFYSRGTTAMQKLSAQTDKLYEQISTGKKLVSPSDDAVGYQRLQLIARANADGVQDATNVQLAQLVLEQAGTAMTQITDALQRASELVVQGKTGTNSASAQEAIATELEGILSSIVSLANGKDARGAALFGGKDDEAAVTLNAGGALSFAKGKAGAMPIGDGQSVEANVNAGTFLATETTDLGTALTQIITALRAGEAIPTDASDALTAISDQTTAMQASLGARAARVDIQAGQISAAATDREIARSGIEDVDATAAVTELQKTMTILQATQASFTKLSSLSLFDYLR